MAAQGWSLVDKELEEGVRSGWPGPASQRAEDIARGVIEFETLEDGEQLPLFVSKVVLHDGGHALEVASQFVRVGRAVHGGAEALQEVSDHRVVMLEGPQDGCEMRMRGFESGEQDAVLALVVPVECDAEAVAVEQ